jgi:GTP pyrophosphokinase
MVPLNTPLRNGQTVEIVVAKEGGPSRDWLNPELGYLAGQRARGKVRAWFNARAMHETVARGRDAVEKVLQREGKTAVNQEELARELGFDAADALFEAVGKDAFSLRQIEALYRPGETSNQDPDAPLIKAPTQDDKKAGGGVLVVGVDSLLTQLARCCKPAPPDPICGFVTRGKGVSVHRADCPNVREFRVRNPERVIDVQWGKPRAEKAPVYPVDVVVQAIDRQGLLRDLSEVFLKEKMNVIGVQTQTLREVAWMTFTVETSDALRLQQVLGQIMMLPGVRSARRR